MNVLTNLKYTLDLKTFQNLFHYIVVLCFTPHVYVFSGAATGQPQDQRRKQKGRACALLSLSRSFLSVGLRANAFNTLLIPCEQVSELRFNLYAASENLLNH